MDNIIFTNTTLLRANQCRKSFYLNLHYPELRDDIKENHQSVSERRKMVSKLMIHLFPKGKFAGIDVTGSCEMSYVLTKELLNTESRTIFNACFKYGDLFCFADVLHKVYNKWNVFEIWEENDSKNSVYLTATYQRYILQKSKINEGSFSSIVYHPQRNKKDVIDLNYDINSLDNQIRNLQNSLVSMLEELRKIAKHDSIPEIIQGKQCNLPKQCDFYNYCKFSGNN